MGDLREMLGPDDYEKLARFVAFIRPEDILYSEPFERCKRALGRKGTIKPEAAEWLHQVNPAQWKVNYPRWTREKLDWFVDQLSSGSAGLPLDRK